MKTLGREKERILKLLIADISALSQVDEDNCFHRKSKELNLIEFIFNLIRANEFTSDFLFSANLFLLKSCNDQQSENGFDAILVKIDEYLKKCVEELKVDENHWRETRDLKIGRDTYHNKFYALDVDNCGIRTTLNVILDSLILLASKNAKNKNFKKIIYDRFKSSSLDFILEKGNTGEKKLVLDIYKYLACDPEINESMKLSEEMKKVILGSRDYEKILKLSYTNLLALFDQNYETKENAAHDIHPEASSFDHDISKITSIPPAHDISKNPTNQNYILFNYNSTNEERSITLSNRLNKEFQYAIKPNDIECMYILSFLSFFCLKLF